MIVVACLLLLLAALLFRRWQGPELPGYRVQAQPLVQTVVATGRVVAVSRASVGSQVSGVVIERRVREGDEVQPGDVLAVLRAEDIDAAVREAEATLAQLRQSTRPQAEAALREAEARLAQATRETRRRRELLARQLVARETVEQAEQAETSARAAAEQARLSAAALGGGHPEEQVALERLAAARAEQAKTVVRAQVAGTVLTRAAEPGDVVQPGQVLFEVARAGDTELLVPLDEKNLGLLALGQPAWCVADAYPSRPFAATVNFIAPSVDPQRGTLDVRLKVDPVPAFLRQDMTVSVNIETGRRERALVLPDDALGAVAPDGRASVLAVVDGRVEPRQVTLGLRGVGLSEITAGLEPGDQVLADPDAAVEAGERVRVVDEPLPAPGDGASSRNELPMSLD